MFKGVPYGASTAGVRDALVGPGPNSEDCLLLNVWTPGLARDSRRPVMVWLHGGGCRTGSGLNALGFQSD